ncbi:hypothetical protein IG631_14726 [Alternaria alternata]|nr:hypothetical protein IG631_14726 [Alternaria alternata]
MCDHGHTKTIDDSDTAQEHGTTPATMTGWCVVNLLVAPPCSGYIAAITRYSYWDKGASWMTTAQESTRPGLLLPTTAVVEETREDVTASTLHA